MNNYEYIIAGLPILSTDGRETPDTEGILADISEQLSEADKKALGFLLDSYDPEKLDAAFYKKAEKHSNRFIRDYFKYDLGVRNAKVEYLNRNLGRPGSADIVNPDPEQELPEFERREEVDSILEGNDILARERGLDDFYWKVVDELTVMDVFDLNIILAFVVKLKMVERWIRLDEATGRDLFRKLVKEIKENRNI